MRKLVRNPVKVRIERPDYRKFKVADLVINIVENPRKTKRNPKEYTIMESAIQSNPTYSRSRISAKDRLKEKTIRIIVFSQNITDTPYTCFSNGEVEACFPLVWQMTTSLLSRMIVKSGRNSTEVQNEIKSGSSVLNIPEGDWNYILRDAEKYGKVFNKSRGLETKEMEVVDVIDCNTHFFRYLSTCLIN